MTSYIYNDEDNSPMMDVEDPVLKYTTYISRAEMFAADRGEPVPFNDPPEDGCWNCINYNGDFCTKEWNNLDEAYKVEWRDSKEPTDSCEDWEKDEDAVWEDYFEEDH